MSTPFGPSSTNGSSLASDGAEYQSGPGHSRAVTVLEDALRSAGLATAAISHNSRQVRTRNPARSASRVVIGRGTSRARVIKPGKPDISYWDPGASQRVNVEIDTEPKVSRRHQRELRAFDRRSRNIFLVIDPRTGAVLEKRISDPRVRRGVVVRSGNLPTLAELVSGQPATAIRTDAHIPLAAITPG